MKRILTALHFHRSAFLLTFLTFSTIALQTSCVTVNVNFPESAVQKATDDYVRDLYRAKEKGKTPADKALTPAALPEDKPTSSSFSLALISVAYADDFRVSSPKADEIKTRLRSRLSQLIAQKRNGTIGEANNGLIVIRDSKLPPLLKKKVEALVHADNADRLELYHEVVRINGLESSRLDTIRQSFARSFQSLSPSGTWIQEAGGKWTKKP